MLGLRLFLVLGVRLLVRLLAGLLLRLVLGLLGRLIELFERLFLLLDGLLDVALLERFGGFGGRLSGVRLLEFFRLLGNLFLQFRQVRLLVGGLALRRLRLGLGLLCLLLRLLGKFQRLLHL